MLLSSVSNLSRSAKMHSDFFIRGGLQVDSIFVEKRPLMPELNAVLITLSYTEGLFYIYLSVEIRF